MAVPRGNTIARKYTDIIYKQLLPVTARHFPRNNYVYKSDNTTFTYSSNHSIQITKMICNPWLCPL